MRLADHYVHISLDPRLLKTHLEYRRQRGLEAGLRELLLISNRSTFVSICAS